MSEIVVFEDDATKELLLRERTIDGSLYCMGWCKPVKEAPNVPKTELATFENEGELCDYALQGKNTEK